MRVFREVRRNPVEDDTYPALVHVVHEVHEVLWRAVATGGRKIARHLIAPGAVEGMLRDRHQLDMRVPELLEIGRKLMRERAIADLRRIRPAIRPP